MKSDRRVDVDRSATDASRPGTDVTAPPESTAAGFVLCVGWPEGSSPALEAGLVEIVERLRELAQEALPDAETLIALVAPGAPEPTATAFRQVRQAVLAFEPGERIEEAESAGPPAGLCVDCVTRLVTIGGREIPLTRLEFDLLAFLARRPRRVFTRDQLLDRVWEYHYPGSTRTVDTHVRRLRAKLGAQARRITTVRGVGYRWDGTRQERIVIDSWDEMRGHSFATGAE